MGNSLNSNVFQSRSAEQTVYFCHLFMKLIWLQISFHKRRIKSYKIHVQEYHITKVKTKTIVHQWPTLPHIYLEDKEA